MHCMNFTHRAAARPREPRFDSMVEFKRTLSMTEVFMKIAKLTAVATIVAAGLGVSPQSISAGDIVSLQPEQQGAVSFISGGVGDDEGQAIKSNAAHYPREKLFLGRGIAKPDSPKRKVQVTS